jgi:S1-C subfamily serine protease
MEYLTTRLLKGLSNRLADAVERIAPSLVLINRRDGQLATGITYTSDLVLTASHALERSETFTIQTYDNRRFPADLLGFDPITNLALLRVSNIEAPSPNGASEAARVGQFVLAIGRTLRDGVIASLGIVSAITNSLHRGQQALREQYLVTDAPFFPASPVGRSSILTATYLA